MHAAALARVPGAVHRFGLHPSVPAPSDLPPGIADSGRVVALTPDEFRRARQEGPFAYHLMSPFHVFDPLDDALPRFGTDGNVPLVVTLYDLIPLTARELYLPRELESHVYDCQLRLVAGADLVLAISEWTAAQAVEVLGIDPGRVAVIGGGASPAFRPATDDSARRAHLASAAPGLTKPFVLTIGFGDARKNVELLVHAHAALPESLRRSLQLVIAGDLGPVHLAKLEVEIARSGLDPDAVVLTGRIDEPELRALYQSAELFVFPSRAEGFGLPVVEAIACGCPAIVADTSALPEVLEYPPARFDPDDADALAALVERCISDGEFRAGLVAACAAAVGHHTWEAVARRTVDALDRLTPLARRLRDRRSPWRIAFAGPVDPRGSDLARANAGAVRRLSEHAEVDLFVPGGRAGVGDTRGVWTERPVFPIEALGTSITANGYDAVVHCPVRRTAGGVAVIEAGLELHRRELLEAATRVPGISVEEAESRFAPGLGDPGKPGGR